VLTPERGSYCCGASGRAAPLGRRNRGREVAARTRSCPPREPGAHLQPGPGTAGREDADPGSREGLADGQERRGGRGEPALAPRLRSAVPGRCGRSSAEPLTPDSSSGARKAAASRVLAVGAGRRRGDVELSHQRLFPMNYQGRLF